MSRCVRSLASAVALCVALAGCVGVAATTPSASSVALPLLSPSPSPSPTASPSPSPTPKIEPTPTPTPTPIPSPTPTQVIPRVSGGGVALQPVSYAEVVVDDLRVRSKPGVSEESLKLTPKLQPGRLLLVVDGPVRASGYDWYQVAPLKEAFSKEKLPFGWVAAAGKDGAHWIDPVDMECPDLPASIREIDDLDQNGERYYGVACHANREILLDGRFGLEGGECLRRPAWGVEPAPFHPCTVRQNVLWDDTGAAMSFVLSPELDLSIAGTGYSLNEWPTVELSAQYDHPEASTCRNRLDRPELEVPEPDPALTILKCRNQLFVTSMRVIEE